MGVCRIALFSTAYGSSSWSRLIETCGTELNLGAFDGYNSIYIRLALILLDLTTQS